MIKNLLAFFVAVVAGVAIADYSVKVTCDHPEYYKLGEEAKFHIRIGGSTNNIPTNGIVTVRLTNHGPKEIFERKFDLAETNQFDVAGTLNEPGFLMLEVNGKKIIQPNWGGGNYLYSVAYEPDKLKSPVEKPSDFDSYWKGELARVEKEEPLLPQVELMEKFCDKDRNVYRVSFAAGDGHRVSGVLTEPKDLTKGPFLTVVGVPGAGASMQMKHGKGKKGRITLMMNVHYYPTPASDEESKEAQEKEREEILVRYEGLNDIYQLGGITMDRDHWFYHDAIIGLSRAVNWLYEREGVDKTRFVYSGTSQGGGFGIILGALTQKFVRIATYVPALADCSGYLAERRAGWPRFCDMRKLTNPLEDPIAKSIPYYDSANFATMVTCPIRFVAGLSDSVCPAAGATIAHNMCPSKDKALRLVPKMPHAVFKEIYEEYDKWCYGE